MGFERIQGLEKWNTIEVRKGAIRTVVATKDSSKEVREQGIEKL